MFWVVVVLGGFGRQPFTRLRLRLWFASQALFAAALRLLLSRLRGVEVATGSEVLWCIDWPSCGGTPSMCRATGAQPAICLGQCMGMK